jgi:DNA-directed RNA polymerase subunit RPC12/RpoP
MNLVNLLILVICLGINLALVVAAIAYRKPGQVSQYVRCPYCDEKIRAKALVCKHCGSKIEEVTSDEEGERDQPHATGLPQIAQFGHILMLLFSSVLILVYLGVTFSSLHNHDSDYSDILREFTLSEYSNGETDQICGDGYYETDRLLSVSDCFFETGEARRARWSSAIIHVLVMLVLVAYGYGIWWFRLRKPVISTILSFLASIPCIMMYILFSLQINSL